MKWKNLKSQYLVDNEFLKVRQDKVKLPTGDIIDDFFVIERKNVSLIVAMDEEKRIIIKDEYRYPIDKHLIELPGGTFDLGETDPLAVPYPIREHLSSNSLLKNLQSPSIVKRSMICIR